MSAPYRGAQPSSSRSRDDARATCLAALRRLDPHTPRDELEQMLAQARSLGIDQEALGEVQAGLVANEIRARIATRALPEVASLHPLPPGDRCHLVMPVRFGRRRSDQFGHLALTSGWVRFHGALDLSVAWGEVAHVERMRDELVVALHDSHRLLRLRCPTVEDAAVAAVLAEHLAGGAQARPPLASRAPSAC